jgi:molecular chaperone DnaK (HSP70)
MSQFIVSIDLGTTNTVLAYARADDTPGREQVRLFEIDQLVAPGEVGAATLLPSLRYHPAEGELADGATQLPWPQADAQPQPVVGKLARQLGAQVPGRLVASAKSWLSHPSVDRTAAILPWGAADDVAKVSPVVASASYLAHVRSAWNTRFPQDQLEQQQLVLTIPASFDEGARALTLEAAHMAGLPNLRLLEEPQAAFYDWLFRHRTALTQELEQTRLVLVADVGGGTTDFSLIKVEMVDGEPLISRIGVGNHLILGGDNMDLALAHLVETRMAGSAEAAARNKLSSTALSQLTERCRAAKEQLLADDAPERVTVTLLGSGSRLIGGARSAELTREEVTALVVDGFFPLNESQEAARRGRGAIVEFGLPYASDAAITRHLASFLRQHTAAAREALGTTAADSSDAAIPVPDTLLLNGGVFRAAALARRLEAVLSNWRRAPLRVLHNDNPDVAVARGGVAYALGRLGRAPVIGGGSPRSYFLVLDEDRTPGKPQRAICLLPRGSAEGSELRLDSRTFALRVGRPVRFHLASSTAEDGHVPAPGEMVDLSQDDYQRLPPIATVLRDSDAGKDARKEIPVQLATTLSEVGTLEVHCIAQENGQRWQLEFQLRAAAEDHDTEPSPDAAGSDAAEAYPMPVGLPAALEKIDRIFGTRSQQVDAKEVKQLRSHLEQLLGSRENWHTPLLRRLFDALLERAKGRRRSAEHERVWLNLSGFCLRPGFGYALDPWRIEQLWALFDTGAQYHKDSQVCTEWWTMWRRVAGGLPTDAQLRALDDFAFNVQADAQERGRRPQTLVNGSEEDMLRLGASLERIPGNYKAEIGAWMLGQIEQAVAAKADAVLARHLWGLSRVGARQPFHGSAHDVVATETVAHWLSTILALDWKKTEPAAFAAAHLARMTGDRTRDISPDLREEVIRRLNVIRAPANWIAMVQQVIQLDQANEKRILGDSLPPGLKLIA